MCNILIVISDHFYLSSWVNILNSFSYIYRKMAGDKNPRRVKGLTICTPSWRTGRERWTWKWTLNRKRNWITYVASQGSMEIIWSPWPKSWRQESRHWKNLRWLFSYRSFMPTIDYRNRVNTIMENLFLFICFKKHILLFKKKLI